MLFIFVLWLFVCQQYKPSVVYVIFYIFEMTQKDKNLLWATARQATVARSRVNLRMLDIVGSLFGQDNTDTRKKNLACGEDDSKLQ